MASYTSEVQLYKINDYGSVQIRKIEINDEGITLIKNGWFFGRIVKKQIEYEKIYAITKTLDPTKYLKEKEISKNNCN